MTGSKTYLTKTQLAKPEGLPLLLCGLLGGSAPALDKPKSNRCNERDPKEAKQKPVKLWRCKGHLFSSALYRPFGRVRAPLLETYCARHGLEVGFFWDQGKLRAPVGGYVGSPSWTMDNTALCLTHLLSAMHYTRGAWNGAFERRQPSRRYHVSKEIR